MKRNTFKSCFFFLSFILILLTGCNNIVDTTSSQQNDTIKNSEANFANGEVAYITLGNVSLLNHTAARDIFPSNNDLDKTKLTTIKLTGTWAPGTANETNKTLVNNVETWADVPSSISVQTGTWNFTLTAKMNGVDFSGTITNKTIAKGDSPVQLTFELTATEEDCGGLNITVNITNASDNFAEKVLVTLTDLTGAVVGENDEVERPISGGSVNFALNL